MSALVDKQEENSKAGTMMQKVSSFMQHGKEAMQHSKEAILHGKEAFIQGKDALIQGKGKDIVLQGKEFMLQRTESLQHGKDYIADKMPDRLPSLPVDKVKSVLRIGQQGLDKVTEGTFMVENVHLLNQHNRKASVGTLYLTETHLIFVDHVGKRETWILHTHVASVEMQSANATGSPLLLRCKNFMALTFVVPKERDCHDIYVSLIKLSQPEGLEDLYAFNYQSPDIAEKNEGWDLYDLQSEYQRLGVPNDKWVQSNINKEYEICDTYPRYVYVPASASTPVLMGSAKFRSRGRLPVLSYLHRDGKAAICRCSQPLAGFSARCLEDEQMLQAIYKANPERDFMYVVDTRPKINAMANRAAGKGYENENFYTNIKFQFWGIENIHVMRSSLQKVLEVCELKNASMGAYLSGLESSAWLKHIKAILETAVFISNTIVEGTSVLVHCSDGWDRTAQTCALASVLLDPHYRTIDGFQTLIEKEWLSFGHKFTDRCGLISAVDSKEVSPIFTQFIEAVWQLSVQFPQAFEFNERYLLTLHDHVYSCQFGTFIGNCEKDRIDLRLKERTYSLWGHMRQNRDCYLNPVFDTDLEESMPVLKPVTNPQSIRFWKGLYCRYDSGIHNRESVCDTVTSLGDHTASVSDHGTLLERRISNLCKLLGKGEDQILNALHHLSSSESVDFRALLLSSPDAKSPSIGGRSPNNELKSPNNDLTHRRESDSESGFEDGQSIMWKSLECTLGDGKLEDVSIEQLLAELQSVAVEWKTLRASKVCTCAMPFDYCVKKNHCWQCGDVFCQRCMEQGTLPGHSSHKPVPVCKACYVKMSPSTSTHNIPLNKPTLSNTSTTPT